MLDEEDRECRGRRRRIGPRRPALQAAKARPFERTGGDEKRDEEREPWARQEEERGQKPNEKRRRRGDASGKRAFQAAPARWLPVAAAATCSLVRPKRRSRLA